MPEERPAQQIAQGYGVAQAGRGGIAALHIGLTPEQLQAALRAAGEAQQAVISELSRQLHTTQEAVRGFFKILNDSEVPLEKLPQVLAEIAQRRRDLLERLSALATENPEAKAAIEKARTILSRASSTEDYEEADRLLAEAEGMEIRAIAQAEALAQEAENAARQKRRNAAATRAERGELSLARLDYLQVAQHFKAAAEMVRQDELDVWVRYRAGCAGALSLYGEERVTTLFLR
jgi:chromosome segregation ATPase